MSIPVDVANLATALADFGPGYLLTAGANGRVKAVTVARPGRVVASGGHSSWAGPGAGRAPTSPAEPGGVDAAVSPPDRAGSTLLVRRHRRAGRELLAQRPTRAAGCTARPRTPTGRAQRPPTRRLTRRRSPVDLRSSATTRDDRAARRLGATVRDLWRADVLADRRARRTASPTAPAKPGVLRPSRSSGTSVTGHDRHRRPRRPAPRRRRGDHAARLPRLPPRHAAAEDRRA